MTWTLLVSKPAKRDLEELPNRDQLRLEAGWTPWQPIRSVATSNACSLLDGADVVEAIAFFTILT